MSLFSSPTSFRLNGLQSPMMYPAVPTNDTMYAWSTIEARESTGGDHPSLLHLSLLVFEAVMEVVCVALPGYILARMGAFSVENQKFVSNLNMSLFTPCLIFIKLASQLTLSKIAELGVIPVLFVIMTAISYFCALGVSKLFGFEKKARNFVIAMGVFGNSNSLPISLVLSLAHTISGLHWDRIPSDNDSEVAARGILYLLIFQQLGQLLRWTWGYNVLLAPDKPASSIRRYRDDADMSDDDDDLTAVQVDRFTDVAKTQEEQQPFLSATRNHRRSLTSGTHDSAFDSTVPSGSRTPIRGFPSTSTLVGDRSPSPERDDVSLLPTTETSPAPKSSCSRFFAAFCHYTRRIVTGFLDIMNPPLWAMLAAITVASIPALQKLFFTKGTFVNASVTRAVSQSGGVAVPLILVVLGANLANSTKGETGNASKEESKILIASMVSRMLLPFVFTGPILALAAKYVNITILDDPIFLIVCFLLAGAPSALQLSQICQQNRVYEDVITRVLFWSYVVVILPSTLILVITAIEVVHWAV
ncbi:auxin efflux carrier [Pyronema omphalodes]|nr:auxin efflux carrier [Pyronema omphalodes]